MKTNSRFVRSLTAVHLAAVLALAAPPVFGQAAARNTDAEQPTRTASEVPRANQPVVQSTRQKVEASPAGSPFEIEIANEMLLWKGKQSEATLENVIDMLRERHGGANIVLSPGVPRIRINNLKLRATTLEQELDALCVASGNSFVWSPGSNPMVTGAGGGIDPTTGLPAVIRTTGETVPLYILSQSPNTMSRRGVEVFNLSSHFDSLVKAGNQASRQKVIDESLAQIRGIVEATLSAMSQGESQSIEMPVFNFHSGAGVLVVIGTPEALQVTAKVVNALPAGNSSPLTTKIYQLKYSSPSDIIRAIETALTDKRSKLVADTRTDSVLALATEPELNAIEKIVMQLDVAVPNERPPAGPAPNPNRPR